MNQKNGVSRGSMIVVLLLVVVAGVIIGLLVFPKNAPPVEKADLEARAIVGETAGIVTRTGQWPEYVLEDADPARLLLVTEKETANVPLIATVTVEIAMSEGWTRGCVATQAPGQEPTVMTNSGYFVSQPTVTRPEGATALCDPVEYPNLVIYAIP